MMNAMRNALLGAAAALLAGSAHAGLLYANDFDGAELHGGGVSGFFSGLPTEAASAGAWNANGWSGNYGASRDGGNPAPFSGLSLTGLGAHTTVSASFILGFLESWDSSDAGPPFSPDHLEIYIDGAKVADLTYNNALGTVKDTDGNPVLYEYVQANNNTYYSDTLVDYGLTFAHTGSTLDFQFRATGAGWQGGADEGYGLDKVVFTYDGVPSTGGIPEPPSWALMIGGFGLAGAMLRRRRTLLA
jgi:hypothetical protein